MNKSLMTIKNPTGFVSFLIILNCPVLKRHFKYFEDYYPGYYLITLGTSTATIKITNLYFMQIKYNLHGNIR